MVMRFLLSKFVERIVIDRGDGGGTDDKICMLAFLP